MSIHATECQAQVMAVRIGWLAFLSTSTTFHLSSPYIIEVTHTMLPTLRNIIPLLSPNLLFAVVTLSPFLASATPITPRDLTIFSEASNSKSPHMDHKAIFGIVFVLGLFLLIEVGYACVGSRARFNEVSDRASLSRSLPSQGTFVSLQHASNFTGICATSETVNQILSSLRVFKFIEKAADAYVDANDVGSPPTPPTHGGSGGMGDFSHSTQMHTWT
ncbi:hypothetical protein H4582DRAFT_2072011 [Lactarius indigo]|nr:hypothetical protein H4582DRAFT_2072011 [Lactarius indigo]